MFDLRLASMGARFVGSTAASMPPFPAFPSTRDPRALTDARSAHAEALARCNWSMASSAVAAACEVDVTITFEDGRVLMSKADPPQSCVTRVLDRVAVPGSHVSGDVVVRIVGAFR